MTKTNTTETASGTCQICERSCKLKNGITSLHGYKRPGCGWINGRCKGASALPFEVSCDALRTYVSTLTSMLADTERALAVVTDPALMEVTVYATPGSYKPAAPVTYRRGERVDFNGMSVDMFLTTVSGRRDKYTDQIWRLKREIARQTARVESWKLAA